MSNKYKCRLATAQGAMQIISEGGPAFVLETLGIAPKDWELATGVKPWLAVDRARVRRVLDSCIYGVIDIQGLPRFELPAEYIAAIISTFVDASNYFAACTWVTGSVSNEEIIAGTNGEAVQGFEKVTPSELFALVLELYENADKTAKAYSKKTGVSIARLAVAGAKK